MRGDVMLGAASCPWATASAVSGLAGPSSFNGSQSCGQHSEPGPAGSPFTIGGGLFETTFMRSLIEVTKSGEYSRKRGGQISMKKRVAGPGRPKLSLEGKTAHDKAQGQRIGGLPY